MVTAGGDGGGGAARTQGDGREVVAHFTSTVAKVGGGFISELTGISSTPALDTAIGKQGTRMVITGTDTAHRCR